MSLDRYSGRQSLLDCIELLKNSEAEALLRHAREILASRNVRPNGTPRLLWRAQGTSFGNCVFLNRESFAERRGHVAWRGVVWGWNEPRLDRSIHTPDDLEAALQEIASAVDWLTADQTPLTVSTSKDGVCIYLSAAFRRVRIVAGACSLDAEGKKYLAALVARHADAAVV